MSDGCGFIPQEHFTATWHLPAQLDGGCSHRPATLQAAHFTQLRLAGLQFKPGLELCPVFEEPESVVT